MNDKARLISSDLRPANEQELTRVVQLRVESTGRRSVHPADRLAAAQLAAEVVRAIQGANYVILQGPPANPRQADDVLGLGLRSLTSAPA